MHNHKTEESSTKWSGTVKWVGCSVCQELKGVWSMLFSKRAICDDTLGSPLSCCFKSSLAYMPHMVPTCTDSSRDINWLEQRQLHAHAPQTNKPRIPNTSPLMSFICIQLIWLNIQSKHVDIILSLPHAPLTPTWTQPGLRQLINIQK